ncbi:LicD family protein [Exiguobacterium sp. 22311]
MRFKKLYFLQNWHTEKEFAMPFTKLRVNQTIYKEFATKDINFHHGIYIDIFPFDDVKPTMMKRIIQNKFSDIIHKIILIKSNYKIISPEIHQPLKLILKFLPRKLLIVMFENFTTSINSRSKFMVCTGGSYGFYKEIVNKDWFKRI